MKSLIKISTIALATFLMSGNANAQSSRKAKSSTKTEVKRNNNTSSNRITTNNRTSNNTHRIPSKTVNYKKPSTKVKSVRSLPNRQTIKQNGVNYYYSNNRYYTYSGGSYINIPPRKGFRISALPVGYRQYKHANRNYFWFEGIFYIHANNQYEVVEPEIGTIILELPRDYERVVIDGNTYYEFFNVLYEKIQYNGSRAYEVVGYIEQ